jgi:hypothetical protein
MGLGFFSWISIGSNMGERLERKSKKISASARRKTAGKKVDWKTLPDEITGGLSYFEAHEIGIYAKIALTFERNKPKPSLKFDPTLVALQVEAVKRTLGIQLVRFAIENKGDERVWKLSLIYSKARHYEAKHYVCQSILRTAISLSDWIRRCYESNGEQQTAVMLDLFIDEASHALRGYLKNIDLQKLGFVEPDV